MKAPRAQEECPQGPRGGGGMSRTVLGEKKVAQKRKKEQAWAELCQAQVKLGLDKQAVTKTKLKTYCKLRLHSI
jgi:hypothetical protein